MLIIIPSISIEFPKKSSQLLAINSVFGAGFKFSSLIGQFFVRPDNHIVEFEVFTFQGTVWIIFVNNQKVNIVQLEVLQRVPH